MARAHYFASLAGRLSDTVSLAPLVGALAHVYQEGTSTPITETIYSASSGAGTLANPLTAGADGSIEFYLEDEKRVDIVIVATGFAQKRVTVEAQQPQLLRYTKSIFDYLTEAEIADAVSYTASIDLTAKIQTAMTALLVTGGDLLFPAGQYKMAPGTISLGYNAATVSRIKPFRLLGEWPDWRATTGSSAAPSGGTIFDFQGTPIGQGVGCIELFGTGYVEIEGITFYQNGTAHAVPYIYDTNACMQIQHCGFFGHASKSGLTCNQDAILLGHTGSQAQIDGTPTSRFQGYGTVIRENIFNKLRRGVWIRRAGNDVAVVHNTWWNECGSDGGSGAASGAAIEVQGISGSSTGGVKIIGNLIECGSYYYGIRLGDYTSSISVIGNGFYDPGGQMVAFVQISPTNSSYHLIIAGYHPDTVTFVEDNNGTSTIINPHQAQMSSYPQPARYTNASPGVAFEGKTTFSGGDTQFLVQPAANQVEGARLLQIKRSAADDVNPGAEVFSVLQDGSLQITNSANAQVQWVLGGKTWQAVGSGGTFLIYTGSGGSNLDCRANAIRLLKVSDATELFRIRTAPQSSSRSAMQFQSTGPIWLTCTGTPEGQVTAPIGSLCTRDDGGAGTTLYVKESGAGNTGWVAK